VRLLLDTHTLIWAVEQPTKIGSAAKLELESPSNVIVVSAATIWETSIKVGLGKLKLAHPYRQWMSQALNDLGAVVLPITVEFADTQSTLPWHHRDPFDRLLAAQAWMDGIPLVSSDEIFDQYGIQRLWD
jgi:PIN domain nuclease of toxin-antitoxin system